MPLVISKKTDSIDLKTEYYRLRSGGVFGLHLSDLHISIFTSSTAFTHFLKIFVYFKYNQSKFKIKIKRENWINEFNIL